MGLLSETWKDVLLLLSAFAPLVLAVIAVVVAVWQIVQAHQHGERIKEASVAVERIERVVGDVRKETELNRIYSDLIRKLAINLMSTDSIQESRLRALEGSSRKLDPIRISSKMERLSAQYSKIVEEISLLSLTNEVRRQSTLALGAGAGDIETYDLLHKLVTRYRDGDDDAKSLYLAISMIRQRMLESERRLRAS